MKKPSLATTNPELAKQASGWDPTTVTDWSHKKRRWICDEGHVWDTTVHHRSAGRGCPVCAGRQVLAGHNDLATTHPELAKQASGWDPTMVTAGSNKKLGWICDQGHVWSATVHNRSSGRGCPVCSGQQVLAGYNDLKTTHPEITTQAYGWDPTTVTHGSQKRLQWECGRGHRWFTTVSNRTKRNGTGCPGCYHMTFDEMTQRPLKFRDEQRKYT